MKNRVDQDNETLRRIAEYALLHLAGVAEIAGDMGHSLVEDETSIVLLPYDAEHRRTLLLDQIVARLDYCSAGLSDLRAAGLLAAGEKEGISVPGRGEIGQQAQT